MSFLRLTFRLIYMLPLCFYWSWRDERNGTDSWINTPAAKRGKQ